PPTPTLLPYTTLFRSLRLERDVLSRGRHAGAPPGREPPVLQRRRRRLLRFDAARGGRAALRPLVRHAPQRPAGAHLLLHRQRLPDRKSTRLNSSHVKI